MDEKKKKTPCKKCTADNKDSFRQESNTDPLGSYTGNPTDIGDKPEQDADDL